ncbi:MAG: glycoside hydrolase family 3 C-terminal domain-containing protein [Solobacterium sp.]|nr:glycoside hydrolase family 3 C-terminal domain-containing protein [Solobacterium sp.]
MAKMNPLAVGTYMLTGKLIGKLPFRENSETALRIAQEGIVLLKNDGVLPLKTGKLALFGAGSTDTSVCGTGSGYAFSPYTVSVYQGLKDAGYEITSDLWIKNYGRYKKESEKKGKKLTVLDKRFSGMTPYFDVAEITEEEVRAASSAETAVYVIKRNTGEGFDRKAEKGDYYLSDNEKANIELLGKNFKKTAVVLNTCIIDCSWLQENENVSAVILLGQSGLEAGHALADIISGNISPSGRLTDTFALSYGDYPASETFSHNDGNVLQEDYREDIYVGYRHFDTKKLDVVYPFGYGLSYTQFAYENIEVTAGWKQVCVKLDVRNTGTASSREVVQLYVSAPEGKLRKPYQELKAFAKTETLAPGKTERISLCFETKDLASYDEERSCWLMEKGKYLLRLGRHSRDTEIIAAAELDEDVVTVQLEKELSCDRELEFFEYLSFPTAEYEGTVLPLKGSEYAAADGRSTISRTLKQYACEDRELSQSSYKFRWNTGEEIEKVRTIRNATLLDVADGKITMEEFVSTLDDEVLVRLLTGSGQETPYQAESRLPKNAFRSVFNSAASGKTTDLFSKTLGIPAASLADGPAGLHLMGTPSTAFPVGMVLAQTFNRRLSYEMGDAYGKEMEHCDIALCLGPGMNIHRDPLCGRNFEYYSEDPLVTGFAAMDFTNGLQEKHQGFGVALKHFCCNNQESERANSNSSVSERALREIYLKGFEIAVKGSHPATVMSSYNKLNGIHTSSRYDLLTDVLRGEWGFDGFVMTDWDGASDRIEDLAAGNDIIMGGYTTDVFIACMNGKAPEFNEDGSVKQKKIKMYGGVMSKTLDLYNAFLPAADGPDTVEAPYRDEPAESVRKLCEEGTAVIDTDRKVVIYKGYDRSRALKRSMVQRNAIRVLNYLAFGAPMKISRRSR